MLGKLVPTSSFQHRQQYLRLGHPRRAALYFTHDHHASCHRGADFRDARKISARPAARSTHPRDSLRPRKLQGQDEAPVRALSDEDETVCKLFGVIKMKNVYGRKVRGIERSTLVVDSKGVLAREWRGVKVPGHVQEVLNFVKAL
jgi:peroxiredoxin Q/BCP